MKKISLTCLVFLFSFTLLINYSCNNAAVEPAHPDSTTTRVDSPATVVDSTRTVTTDTASIHADTGRKHIHTAKPIAKDSTHDTTSIPPTDPQHTTAKQAVLGYSYFKEMKRKETKYIHAFISVTHADSKVKDTLKALNAADGLQKGNDTTSIFTKNMNLYRFVDISLVNTSDSGFEIVKIHDADRQLIDSVAGNHWEWAVTPITEEKTGVLVLKVVAEKPDGSKEAFQAQSIPIKIAIQRNLLRRVWAYMIDNPGIVLTAILIPLFGFIGRSIFNKRKKAADEGK